SEKWYADSGATGFITPSAEYMYDLEPIPPDRQNFQVGNATLAKVKAIGKLDIRFHQENSDR
ncbi:unnamed protein product, partial [Hapterophycus canaliculatus]